MGGLGGSPTPTAMALLLLVSSLVSCDQAANPGVGERSVVATSKEQEQTQLDSPHCLQHVVTPGRRFDQIAVLTKNGEATGTSPWRSQDVRLSERHLIVNPARARKQSCSSRSEARPDT